MIATHVFGEMWSEWATSCIIRRRKYAEKSKSLGSGGVPGFGIGG